MAVFFFLFLKDPKYKSGSHELLTRTGARKKKGKRDRRCALKMKNEKRKAKNESSFFFF